MYQCVLRAPDCEEAKTTVEISLPTAEVATRMGDMRMWLDHRRFEPSKFACTERDDETVVLVEFKVGDEARAFAGWLSRDLAI